MSLKFCLLPLYILAGSLIAFSWGVTAYADIPYDLDIIATGSGELDSALADGSQLKVLEDRAPESESALRSRAANDRGRLDAVAHAYGYYDSAVDIKIDVTAKPVHVTIAVTPGPLYVLSAITIEGAGSKPLPSSVPVITPESLGLKISMAAQSAPIAAANGKIEHVFRAKGYPFARIADRKAVVDHGAKQMEVTYSVDPGPSALFGQTSYHGLQSVHEAYVARRLHWAEGDLYDATQVDKTRDALIASNLFSTVQIDTGPPAANNGSLGASATPVAVPMAVDVTERLPRSVSGGIAYASTEGVSANATWEHRNLFGEAEDLKFGLLVGQELSDVTADFRKPDILPDSLGADWDFVANATVKKEDANAYTSKGERLFGGLEYKGLPQIVIGAGLALEHATIDDYELQQHYVLVGIPLYAKRDSTDDLLNPTKGNREGVTITPYIDPARPDLHFVSGRVNGSIYQRLGDSDRYVLAALGAVGSTLGIDLDQLPKDKRFYVGGGGSVRGYGFQRVGPLNIHDQPIGGLSSFEASLELRYKLTETIGLVPFLDAGNVYSSSLPDLSQRLFLGAGLGVRYYTALAPLRLDLAAPLHEREGDRPFQIYVSLGQAF